MLLATSPLARRGAFRAELHAAFTRRADALFELGDALLCAQGFGSLPHLRLEPVGRRGWAAPTPPWPAARSTPSGCATCWLPPCPTLARWWSRST
jgi:hypothetical protein